MRRKRLSFLALFLAALLLAGSVALKLWLQTDPLRRTIVAVLSEHYDGHFEIGSVSYCLQGGATIREIKLHEGRDSSSPVICTLDRVDIRASLSSLFEEQFRPTSIIIHRPELHLRCSSNGVKADIPIRIPERHRGLVPIHIENGSVVLHDDRSSLSHRFQDLWVDMHPRSAGVMEFEAHLRDELWSNWTASGTLDRVSKHWQVQAVCEQIRVSSAHMKWAGENWQEVFNTLAPEGDMRIDLTVNSQGGEDGAPFFQVLLDPRNMSCRLPTVPKPIEHLRGRIELRRDRITIQKVIGALGKGQFSAYGTVKGREDPIFDLVLSFSQLNVAELLAKPLDASPISAPHLDGVLRLAGRTDPSSWAGSFNGRCWDDSFNDGQPLQLDLGVSNGTMAVQNLEIPMAGGSMLVNADIPLQRAQEATGDVRIRGVQLADMAAYFSKAKPIVWGTADANLDFRVQVGMWAELDQWVWEGPARLTNAIFGKVRFNSILGVLKVQNRRLELLRGSASIADFDLSGAVVLELSAPYKIDADFATTPRRLANMGPQDRIETPVDGTFESRGELSGELKPRRLSLTGTAGISDLVLKNRPMPFLGCAWALNGSGFDISDARLEKYGGVLQGKGRLEWEKSNPKNKSLTLWWDVQSCDLSMFWDEWLPDDCKLEGLVSGFAEVRVPMRQGQEVFIHGHLNSPAMKVSGYQLRTVVVPRFEWTKTDFVIPKWTGSIRAGSLNGSFDWRRRDEIHGWTAEIASTPTIDLKKLWSDLNLNPDEIPVSGQAVFAGELGFDSAGRRLRGSAKVHTAQLKVSDHLEFESLETTVRFEPSQVVLENCIGSVLGGEAKGVVSISTDRTAQDAVQIVLTSITDIDLTRLGEVFPQLSNRVTRGTLHGVESTPGEIGRFFVRRGKKAEPLAGSMEVVVRNARVAGLPVSWCRAQIQTGGVDAQHQPVTVRKAANVPHIRVSVTEAESAGGYFWGQGTVLTSEPHYLDAAGTFWQMDLATVTQAVFHGKHPGNGKLSFNVAIRGPIAAKEQLRGRVNFAVTEANLWQQPVTGLLGKAFTLDPGRETGFEKVTGQGILRNGLVEFQEISMTGGATEVEGRGGVALDGRIDLEFQGHVQTPLKRAPLLGMFNRAFDRLQHELVKVRIVGTVDNPRRVPVPFPEAVRLLRESGLFRERNLRQ